MTGCGCRSSGGGQEPGLHGRWLDPLHTDLDPSRHPPALSTISCGVLSPQGEVSDGDVIDGSPDWDLGLEVAQPTHRISPLAERRQLEASMGGYPPLKPGQIILVNGPARSGKSAWAEALAVTTQQSVIYVATGQRNQSDPEWLARIEAHRRRRPLNWQTLEVPTDLCPILRNASAETCLLIDSLGTWLANHIEKDARTWEKISDNVLESLQSSAATLIFVSEEVGWGIVPAYPLGRTFRDRLGTLTQQIARRADYVYLVTAGIALNLKELGSFIPD